MMNSLNLIAGNGKEKGKNRFFPFN